jgi:DNA polymerase-3 subunit chi
VNEVAFHFNVPDKQAYVCQLLRKAVNTKAKVLVLGSVPNLLDLDRALWTFAPTEFVPHCVADASPSMVSVSPVVLSPALSHPALADWHRHVLLNLLPEVPVGFEAFQRLIEVVSQDGADRAQARQRWKHYVQIGHAPIRHDRGGAGRLMGSLVTTVNPL